MCGHRLLDPPDAAAANAAPFVNRGSTRPARSCPYPEIALAHRSSGISSRTAPALTNVSRTPLDGRSAILLSEGTLQYQTKDGDWACVRKIRCRTFETEDDPELDLSRAWGAPSLSMKMNVRRCRM